MPLRPLFLLLALLLGAATGAAAQDVPDVPAAGGDPGAATEEAGDAPEGGAESTPPPVWLVVPFVALLGMIATGPLFYPHHWHHHYPKYAVGLGVLVAAYYLLMIPHGGEAVLHGVTEYVSFIALLASLFVASGGILIETSYAGTPRANTALLFVGALLANVIGTTGASMLLIRPYMRLNRGRLRAYHIIFFIFAVSNVGGALTPIGDPPLFLGFLRGVPFFWTIAHLWYVWLPALLLLLGVFYVFDSRNKEHSLRETVPSGALPEEDPADPQVVAGTLHGRRIRVVGGKNFLWLAVVIVAVFLDPNIIAAVPDLHALYLPFGIRELIMLGVCYLAYVTASKAALRGNDFTFEPIKEVAWLFIGIFLTMIPALRLIEVMAAQNAEALTVTHFYFGTGFLSSFLDNAPTYLSFLSAAMGKFAADPQVIADMQQGLVHGPFTVENRDAVFAMAHLHLAGPDTWHYVQAISIAAVFFGAMTYIGNGPNFMVKAIAESAGVDCPSFFGYILRYSIPILLPIFVLVWLVFFSGYVVRLI